MRASIEVDPGVGRPGVVLYFGQCNSQYNQLLCVMPDFEV